MKKLAFIICILAFALNVKACDICGCGVGSNYIGILPEFSKHIMGLRYRYSTLQTHIGADGATTYLTTRENYQTAELWAGWNIGSRFRVMATLPYSFNERINQGQHNTKNGLGDISLNGYFQAVNSRKTISHSRMLVQSLWLGGGIKLPTGQYDPADKSTGAENTNLFQLGTGSVDFNLGFMYDVRLQDAGINVAGSYQFNTANKYHYEYGNKYRGNVQAYYKFRLHNKLVLAPNAGLLYEHAQTDMDNKLSVDISGGNVFAATAGLELSYKRIGIGGNFQSPLSQNLAHGIIKAGNRAMVHVSFLF